MNALDLIRSNLYNAIVIIALFFAVPFFLAGDIGYLWAFMTMSFALGLRKLAQIGTDIRIMRESVSQE